MAIPGYVNALLGGLDEATKRVLTQVFQYVLPNAKFGPVDHQTKSESFQGYYLQSTSATSTGEFSIQHGLGRTPYLLIPVAPLDLVGSRLIPLTITRAADDQRVYLKTEAGSTSAPFSLYLE